MLPLCVDLDGTLISTDILVEALLSLIRQNPLYIFLLPGWLMKGKAGFKAEVAQRAMPDIASLPYRADFRDWLKQEKSSGRPLWLCTAAHDIHAQAIAAEAGLFDGVIATTVEGNLAGEEKARALVARFGEKGFDYCGNERKDLAIWRRSRAAIIVNAGSGLEEEVRAAVPVAAVFPAQPRAEKKALLKAMRPLQWAKNALIFIPLIAAHRVFDVRAIVAALAAFVAFSLCASAIYIINDMLDLAADRLHPRKALRPFAAGKASLLQGGMLAIGCFILAFLGALCLPWGFIVALAGYAALSLSYSLVLKRLPVADILSLAALYAVRIGAGAMAVAVPLSFWLLLFSVFFFLSLALVKRYAELDMMRRAGRESAMGRGYLAEDLPLLQVFGVVAGYLSVLVLAFYINSPDISALYRCPQLIWFLCLLELFWISRIWFKAHRGKMPDDPVLFALKDRVSYVVGGLGLLTVLAAT